MCELLTNVDKYHYHNLFTNYSEISHTMGKNVSSTTRGFQKLADTLAKHQMSVKKNLNYFIQVNIGNEIQKSGIPVGELDAFYNYCTNEINLKIIGLMVIPPVADSSEKYFKLTNQLNKSLALENLSMGMSADYSDAIKNGSNFVRIGNSIFGQRS